MASKVADLSPLSAPALPMSASRYTWLVPGLMLSKSEQACGVTVQLALITICGGLLCPTNKCVLALQICAISEDLLKTEYDALRIVYNRFGSAVSFKPTIATVLSPDVSPSLSSACLFHGTPAVLVCWNNMTAHASAAFSVTDDAWRFVALHLGKSCQLILQICTKSIVQVVCEQL